MKFPTVAAVRNFILLNGQASQKPEEIPLLSTTMLFNVKSTLEKSPQSAAKIAVREKHFIFGQDTILHQKQIHYFKEKGANVAKEGKWFEAVTKKTLLSTDQQQVRGLIECIALKSLHFIFQTNLPKN